MTATWRSVRPFIAAASDRSSEICAVGQSVSRCKLRRLQRTADGRPVGRSSETSASLLKRCTGHCQGRAPARTALTSAQCVDEGLDLRRQSPPSITHTHCIIQSTPPARSQCDVIRVFRRRRYRRTTVIGVARNWSWGTAVDIGFTVF